MTKTLNDYTDSLPPIPATVPGLYRWRLYQDIYPRLAVDKYRESRWYRSGYWKEQYSVQLFSRFDRIHIMEAGNNIVRSLVNSCVDSNVVMAERV